LSFTLSLYACSWSFGEFLSYNIRLVSGVDRVVGVSRIGWNVAEQSASFGRGSQWFVEW